jgi:hypothetical protein
MPLTTFILLLQNGTEAETARVDSEYNPAK